MATNFLTFVVAAEGDESGEYDQRAVNLFERHFGDAYNLDGRYETVVGGDTYVLALTIAPLQIQPGSSVHVTIVATKNGQPLQGQVVDLESDAPSVAEVPSIVTTNADGRATFQIIGGSVGDAIITASMDVDGVTVFATPVELVVTEQAPAEDHDATGYGVVEWTLEPRLVRAMHPRVDRLSHQRQQQLYPGDDGFKWATKLENTEFVWKPAGMR